MHFGPIRGTPEFGRSVDFCVYPEKGLYFGYLPEEMLAYQMTVDQVAERLGYAETSSFAHAFKRWKGISPGAYRRQPRRRRAAR